MTIEIVYFLVLLFDILAWIFATHTYCLMQYLEATFVFDRRLLQSLDTSRLKAASRRVLDLFSKDDKNINGFNPPRALRLVVAFAIAVENILMMMIPWSDEAISAGLIVSQSGYLCYMNILPLCLLAMPENAIFSGILRQCREQWLWAHAFFGWLITCQVVFHVVASLFLISRDPGPSTSSWTTGSTKHTSNLSWLGAHWILSSVVCLLAAVHVMLRLPWALMLVVTVGVILLSGTAIARRSASVPASIRETMEMATLPKTQLRILEVEVPSPITAGQSYYFRVGGVPIRVAWMRRHTNQSIKRQKYIAVLFHSVDTDAPQDLEVRGPYTIPITSPIATSKNLDIVTLDSGIVEAYHYQAWRYALQGKVLATSLTWFNESPEMLRAWLTHAGFKKDLPRRIICYGKSYQYLMEKEFIRAALGLKTINHDRDSAQPDYYGTKQLDEEFREAISKKTIVPSDGSIEDLLQDYMPPGRNPYGDLVSFFRVIGIEG